MYLKLPLSRLVSKSIVSFGDQVMYPRVAKLWEFCLNQLRFISASILVNLNAVGPPDEF
jgi:hypothetical protein